MKTIHLVPFCAFLLAGTGFPMGGGAAFGYAGEAGSGDGPNAAYLNLRVSTHHTHLTRALAYCAGLPGLLDLRNPVNPLVSPEAAQLSETIALNDELTDQGTITGQGGPTWTNIDTESWSYTLPAPSAFQCDAGLTMVFPILQGAQPQGVPANPFWDPQSGFFTHRFGPWAAQFHFPASDDFANDLATLRAFALGSSQRLQARSVYGFGGAGATTWSGSCYGKRQETVATGKMKPGSVEAFATYLHALGDSHSHKVCHDHWDGHQRPPWYYHTPPPALVYGCAFNDHAFEFGCPETERRAAFIKGTVEGGVEVFGALLEYAKAKGYKPRITSIDAHGNWLLRQIERYAMAFKTNTNQDAGACRVSYTYALMKVCAAAAARPAADCLPDVAVADGGACPADGQTTGCQEGTRHFPITKACVAPKASSRSVGAVSF